MKEKKLLILTDDNGYLCTSLNSTQNNNSADVKAVAKSLEANGWQVDCISYDTIDYDSNYTGYYIIYASSEDYGQFYKDYIEDVLLWFIKQGNVLLPSLYFFRSHHNKMFMELLKTTFKEDRIKTIHSQFFSSFTEFKKRLSRQHFYYPVVVKAVAGAGSKGVGLAKNKSELIFLAQKYSKRIYFDYYANWCRVAFLQYGKNLLRKLKGEKQVCYRKKSGKFIIQDYVPGLKNDFKVLIFGDKFYILKRINRDGDFRASGSGKFSFPQSIDEVRCILNFANLVKNEIRQPMMSLDIAFDGETCHLIEFQCVSFGPYTLERSDRYFIFVDGHWRMVKQKSLLEEEIAYSLEYYYNKYEA